MITRKKLALIGFFVFATAIGGIIATFYSSNSSRNELKSREMKQKKNKLQSPSRNQEIVNQGKQLYQRYCVTCHGRKGKGNGPAAPVMDVKPGNFHDKRIKNLSSKELFDVLTNGKQNRGMPAWKSRLTVSQRWSIISYIQTRWTGFPDQNHDNQ